ncbi:MAG: FAD-dependent oxidoreductase [Chloroflexi bacterium]|nr:FAD-dependent oxidoreductase [Chloroflexota bacterium]
MTDVIIVGGGVIGLLCARELRRKGLEVTLLERDRPGRQASWASAGILTAAPPGDVSPDGALKRLSAEKYPGLVAELREESGVNAELTWDGHLVPAFSEREAEGLRLDGEHQRRLGLETELVTAGGVQQVEPAIGPAVIAAQLRPGGQIDNRRLCRALELAERRAGVQMVYGAAVSEILEEGGRVVGARTLAGDFHAPVLVNAAGSWSGQLRGSRPAGAVAPQRGEILALDQAAVGLRRVITKPGDPYLVPRVDGRLIVGATRRYVGYDASFTAGGLAWLLNEAIAIVPALAEAPVHELWTGFRPNSADGLPLIGAGALDGLYLATGHGPSGIAPAPATACLLAALVVGETPPIPSAAFDPLRFAKRQVALDPRGWGVRGGPRV